MHAPWRRAAAIALATCGLTSISLLSGCKTDSEKSTADVSAIVDKAADTLAKGGPDSATTAIQSLQKVVSNRGASPQSQIESNVLLAQAEVAAADQLMDGRAGEPGILQKQSAIARLLGDMSTLASELELNNVRLAGYRALEPTEGRKAVAQIVTAAQKGDNGVWVAGTAPIASLDATKQHEQDLQKQIDDLTHQRDDLNAKRMQALADAANFGQQADASSGKESVGFYTQASNQRKEAADDETKIQALEGQLLPLQQDLAVAQLQDKATADIITGFSDQTQQMDNGWKAVQSHIDEATAFSKSLIEGATGADAPAPTPPPAAPAADASGAATPVAAPPPPPTPRNLSALGTDLDSRIKDVQDQRAKAIELYNNAFKHYEAAKNVAKTLTLDLTRSSAGPDALKLPERHAWQEEIAINTAANFELEQSAIEGRLARLFTDVYVESGQRVALGRRLDAVFKQSGLTAPAVLASVVPTPGVLASDVDSQVKGVEGDLKSDAPPFEKDVASLVELSAAQPAPIALQSIAMAQADLAYKWSATLLSDAIANSGQGDFGALLANVGHLATMSDDYGTAQLALLQGKDQDAAGQIKAAVTERDALVDANARNLLPSVLPAELAFPIQAISPEAPKPPAAADQTATPAPAPATPAPATPPATPAGGPAPTFAAPPDNAAPAAAPTAPAAPAAMPPAAAPADSGAPAGATPPAATTPPAMPATPAPADAAAPPAAAPTTAPADASTPPAPAPATQPAQ